MYVKPRTHGWIGVTKNKIGSLKADIAISVANPFPFCTLQRAMWLFLKYPSLVPPTDFKLGTRT